MLRAKFVACLIVGVILGITAGFTLAGHFQSYFEIANNSGHTVRSLDIKLNDVTYRKDFLGDKESWHQPIFSDGSISGNVTFLGEAGRQGKWEEGYFDSADGNYRVRLSIGSDDKITATYP